MPFQFLDIDTHCYKLFLHILTVMWLRLGVVAQWVKLPLVLLASHIKVPVQILAALSPSHVLCNASQKVTEHGPWA